MSRRVYLAGECSSEWLGCDWRQVYALAVQAAGLEPAWPPNLDASLVGDAAACAALRARYARDPGRVLRRCLDALARCHAVLARLDGREGAGTACELAYARACGIPVVAHYCGASTYPDLVAGVDADEYDDLGACVLRLAAPLTR